MNDWNPQPGNWHPSHNVTAPDSGDLGFAWWCQTCARLVRSPHLGITSAGVAACNTTARDLVEKYWGVSV